MFKGFSKRGKCMVGVMAHPGFGSYVIYRPSEGIRITLPRECLRKNDGRIKKAVLARLSELTVGNMTYLSNKYNASFEKVNHPLVANY